jgi:PadR family transcriptional regulator, regulatory protein PadR
LIHTAFDDRGHITQIASFFVAIIFLHLGNIYCDMKKYQLGEFEEIVMLTVGILYKEAYGVSIKKEIESRLSRNVSIGALHTALKRLEDKGYILSFDGEATEERAGRPKKYFQITALGKKAMEYTRTTREELWQAIPKISLKVKMAG